MGGVGEMPRLNIYLNFKDNCEEAFNFYKSVFGGEFRTKMRFKDMPMPGARMAEEEADKIMHIALPIGEKDVLMGSDMPKEVGQKLVEGNNVRISLTPDSKEDADRLFNALSDEGKVEMSMADQPWGDYYGSCKDKYGINWMIDYAYPKEETKIEPLSAAPVAR